MQRTFNYTGRKKIEQTEVLFSFKEEGDILSFDAEFRIREDKSFPKEASLYVEAHCKETRQRFYFGTVSKIVPPKDRSLSEINLSGPTLFRVIIVDESSENGLLLASGDNFRADKSDEAQDRNSIISVAARDLGQLPWRVDFETGSVPELVVNKNIPNAIDKIRSDPYFQSLVLPSVLKQVLTHYLFNESEDDEVSNKWIDFAKGLAGAPPHSEDYLKLGYWVDEVVNSFSERFSLCERLLSVVKEY